jgi:hypothetical protein
MPSRGRLKLFALALGASTLLLASLLAMTWVHLHRLGSTVEALRRDLTRMQTEAPRDSRPALRFSLSLPPGGEIFPAAATSADEPIATVRITNASTRRVAQTLSASIPGWSLQAEQTLVLEPGETRSVHLQPELLPRAYENDETQRAQLEVRSVGPETGTLFAERRVVLLHGGSKLDWGSGFAKAGLSARWVTPHDRAVLQLVSEARRYVVRGRLAGYAESGGGAAVEAHVRAQAAAIYNALQRRGVRCEASGLEDGGAVQRIRLPLETLREGRASCLDVTVAFASALENLGLQPLLVVVPGHVLAAVRLQRGSEELLLVDLGRLPGEGFEAASARARRLVEAAPRDRRLTVDVAGERRRGVYPLVERAAASETVLAAQALPR